MIPERNSALNKAGELGVPETSETAGRFESLSGWIGPILLILLLLLTNRYPSLASEAQILPGDCFSYLRIASAFPGLPTSNFRYPCSARIAFYRALPGGRILQSNPFIVRDFF